MPGFTTGSMSAVHANGVIFACGGINSGGATVNPCTQYTTATGLFSAMASMPVGVNHAAYATDGVRFFVFGGR